MSVPVLPTRRWRRSPRWCALTVVLALGASACGGSTPDGDGSDASPVSDPPAPNAVSDDSELDPSSGGDSDENDAAVSGSALEPIASILPARDAVLADAFFDALDDAVTAHTAAVWATHWALDSDADAISVEEFDRRYVQAMAAWARAEDLANSLASLPEPADGIPTAFGRHRPVHGDPPARADRRDDDEIARLISLSDFRPGEGLVFPEDAYSTWSGGDSMMPDRELIAAQRDQMARAFISNLEAEYQHLPERFYINRIAERLSIGAREAQMILGDYRQGLTLVWEDRAAFNGTAAEVSQAIADYAAATTVALALGPLAAKVLTVFKLGGAATAATTASTGVTTMLAKDLVSIGVANRNRMLTIVDDQLQISLSAETYNWWVVARDAYLRADAVASPVLAWAGKYDAFRRGEFVRSEAVGLAGNMVGFLSGVDEAAPPGVSPVVIVDDDGVRMDALPTESIEVIDDVHESVEVGPNEVDVVLREMMSPDEFEQAYPLADYIESILADLAALDGPMYFEGVLEERLHIPGVLDHTMSMPLQVEIAADGSVAGRWSYTAVVAVLGETHSSGEFTGTLVDRTVTAAGTSSSRHGYGGGTMPFSVDGALGDGVLTLRFSGSGGESQTTLHEVS